VRFGKVAGLGAVEMSVWNSCQRPLSKLLVPAIRPCSVTAFQPWCQMPRWPNIS
jgi:hypothetical protein